VFARIAEANEVLGNEEARDNYDRQLAAGPVDVDVNRIAQAEGFFMKGEVLARMGNFRDALQHLESAVAVYPDESDYQSLLGWALYKLSEPGRARGYLDRAVELKPDNAQSLFRLGHLLKSQGDPEGDAVIARARDLDPSVKGI